MFNKSPSANVVSSSVADSPLTRACKRERSDQIIEWLFEKGVGVKAIDHGAGKPEKTPEDLTAKAPGDVSPAGESSDQAEN